MIPRITREAEHNKVMNEFKHDLSQYEAKGMLSVFADSMRIELADVTFESGSACPDSSFKPVFEKLGSLLQVNLEKYPQMGILIEGHTDPKPVNKLVKSCGYFETNFQLSTLRAINVRDEILTFMSDSLLQSRVGASGYGDTRLIDKQNPFSARNRRIEIRFLF
jgi:chemotaxis protein MotB